MSDLIDRQVAIDDIWTVSPLAPLDREWIDRWLRQLPPAQPEIINCDRCVATKRGECIWHNAGAAYCSLGEVTE